MLKRGLSAAMLAVSALLTACDGPAPAAYAPPDAVSAVPPVAALEEDDLPRFNIDPVANPLDRPGDLSVPLPASLTDPAAYDQQRNGLFDAYRSTLKREYVVVAQDATLVSDCAYAGTSFHAATDMIVVACPRHQQNSSSGKTLHYFNLRPGMKAIEISTPAGGARFSPDGSKLFVCWAASKNKTPASIVDLISGEITALPDAARPACRAKFEWAEEWRLVHVVNEYGTREYFDLKTLAVNEETTKPADSETKAASAQAIEHWKRNWAASETFAQVGANGIRTFVFDRDYGNSTVVESPSGRWIVASHESRVSLVHLKILGDYAEIVPSISFRITEEDAAALKEHGGEAAWQFNIRRELRNPLVDNAVVGGDPKSNFGEFRLIGCGADLVCDGIPVKPTEKATQAFNRFSSDVSGLVVTDLRPGENSTTSTPFASDRFWVAETGRLR